jgi:hypothetical protein
MKSSFMSSLAPRLLATCGALLVVAAIAFAQDSTPVEEKPDATPEQIAALEKTLNGATLVGHFTVTGRNDGDPHEERYELGEVKHLDGNKWLISARIKYGEHDLAIPLTLPIRWAGDTPVITVDEMAFPGMGSYTARVMIYRDHYAGFWTGKDHGGHLYGTLEQAKDDEKKDDAEAAK